MSVTARPPETVPERTASLGLWMCTALVIGNMVGSGIFLLPSALAAFGPIAVAGWMVTAVGALTLALIFGRLARLAPATGGPYAYARMGFGDFAGFLIAWGYWIALWSGNAAVAVAFAGYLGVLIPRIDGSQIAELAAALGAIWLLTWLNVRGVREAGLFQLVTAVMKLVPLLVLVVFGIAYVDTANFTPVNTSGQSAISAIAACAALTLWAFLGLESATVPAGDVIDPERTIPRATVMGTLVAGVIYIAVTLVAFGVVPVASLAGSSAPLADMARQMWGAAGAVFVAVGACIATIGTLNGFILLTGQVPLGAARDGVFPSRFAGLSATGTPAFGLLLSSALASGLILMNYSKTLAAQFEFIILLATLSTLVPYLVCALAELMIYLARGRTVAGRELIKVVVLGAIGFAYTLWAIYGAGQDVVFWGFLLLMAGLPFYVLLRWTRGAKDNLRGDVT